MKTTFFLLILSFQAILCFAELHTPDTILSTEDALLQQGINVRRTATAAHKKQEYREYQPQATLSQETLPMPELIPFQQAVYPIMYYQPAYWQVQAWQQQQAAMRLAAYYPPAPILFEPEVAQSTPTPKPTATPEPTPVVQQVIEKRIIVYVTPTPAATPNAKAQMQEAQTQHIEKLTAETEKARQDAVLWLSIFISFCAGTAGAFVYLLKIKKED